MITPTIGRIIYVRNRHANTKKDLPEEASIAFVHENGLLNVAGHDHHGMPFVIHELRLVQEGEAFPDHGAYAEWMPYQKAVAKGETEAVKHAT